MDMEMMIGAPQGWQCPICKRVYSPTTPLCFYCGGGGQIDVNTKTDGGDYPGGLPNTSTTPLDLNYKYHPCVYGS